MNRNTFSFSILACRATLNERVPPLQRNFYIRKSSRGFKERFCYWYALHYNCACRIRITWSLLLQRSSSGCGPSSATQWEATATLQTSTTLTRPGVGFRFVTSLWTRQFVLSKMLWLLLPIPHLIYSFHALTPVASAVVSALPWLVFSTFLAQPRHSWPPHISIVLTKKWFYGRPTLGKSLP